jgi:hypothetical protein
MIKTNLGNLLIICFEICKSDYSSNSPQPFLTFKMSNYNLSRDEILRAKLRPDKLTLDNKLVYFKSSEEAYFNRNEENMLEVKYSKLG